MSRLLWLQKNGARGRSAPGGQLVLLNVEDCAGRALHRAGSCGDDDAVHSACSEGNQPIQEYYQELNAGHHSFTVELAPKITGTVELHAVEPPVGNTISWTVSRNGRQIAQDSHTLEKPLRAGEAQFLQAQLVSERQEGSE